MKIIIKTIDTIKDNRRQKQTIEYKKKSNRLCTVLFLEIIILKLNKKIIRIHWFGANLPSFLF